MKLEKSGRASCVLKISVSLNYVSKVFYTYVKTQFYICKHTTRNTKCHTNTPLKRSFIAFALARGRKYKATRFGHITSQAWRTGAVEGTNPR